MVERCAGGLIWMCVLFGFDVGGVRGWRFLLGRRREALGDGACLGGMIRKPEEGNFGWAWLFLNKGREEKRG